MKTHLARDLTELESQLSSLGELVIESVQCAIDAISSFDLEKVARIAENEKRINEMEISIAELFKNHRATSTRCNRPALFDCGTQGEQRFGTYRRSSRQYWRKDPVFV